MSWWDRLWIMSLTNLHGDGLKQGFRNKILVQATSWASLQVVGSDPTARVDPMQMKTISQPECPSSLSTSPSVSSLPQRKGGLMAIQSSPAMLDRWPESRATCIRRNPCVDPSSVATRVAVLTLGGGATVGGEASMSDDIWRWRRRALHGDRATSSSLQWHNGTIFPLVYSDGSRRPCSVDTVTRLGSCRTTNGEVLMRLS